MARVSALLIAVAAAVMGVKAGTCPHNGINSFYCGSQLLDVIRPKCTDRDTLQNLNKGANVETSIYYIDENGNPSLFALDCKEFGGCANAGPNGIPQSHCFR